MSPGSHIPAHMADELNEMITQLREPYQARMLCWMESHQRRRFRNLRQELEALLAQMDEFSRVDQYLLLRQVAANAARVFSSESLGCTKAQAG